MYLIIKIMLIISCSIIYARGEIQVLSPRVGTEIDVDENRYYRIFPREKGFISAQIIADTPNQVKVKIIKNVKGQKVQKTATFSMRKFVELQTHVNSQPELTQEALKQLYKGMHFLQASKIVSEMPKPQLVKLKHSSGKKLKGTLLKFDDEILKVQTPTSIELVSLSSVESISYRTATKDYFYLRPYIFAFSAAAGFGGGHIYNLQRNPKADVVWYNRFYGIIIGLIFSGEMFDAFSTLLTPKETFILTEDEYERQRAK
ncbi:MAG: hypothetical protein CMG74_08210 [Candidatus Marinimicrobia bacterium]|nr:hypothetical protein [Candidatus Neomarinimicrobiota bacterium]